jgi:hypothetical protein
MSNPSKKPIKEIHLFYFTIFPDNRILITKP